jgi:phospholipase A-2-activating protein
VAHHGSSEGQVQVFNKDGKAIAAQWSAVSGTWIEVGEVTGSNEHAGAIDGVQYDHVFPIEIDVASGGIQRLQIGYNNGENPFTAAQKFIDDYMLDQGYLAQIADYIRNRVGEAACPTFTGGDAAPVDSGPTPMDITPSPTSGPSYTHLPMRGYKSFETGADVKVLSKVSHKIREFNSSMENNLAPQEVNFVLDGLCQTIAATNRYHATAISDQELSIVYKMMKDWSLEHVFPSIDLARLIALHPDACNSSRSAFWNNVVTCVLDRCEALQTSDLEGMAKTAIPMLSFRLFANCFLGGAGSQSAVELHLVR